MPKEVLENFVKVFWEKSLSELEATIKREPRVVEKRFREPFRAFVALTNSSGTLPAHPMVFRGATTVRG